ncbi:MULTISPECIES: PQQ-binding-like beta-propeller repeat protein [Streptomyces]|uniref:PQQ-binding-like beta-propeller repeat protein n=2 Tax=Streptomyces TaxID=1883 RepID=A0ABU4KB54_9ACTN|nr:PQQ-binding-like beta-propeller repeat protein [Streptomyces roseolus]MDX2294986.1 PQQ-binding-like beta-propeller repeat protein [Streptomyces roseolus]
MATATKAGRAAGNKAGGSGGGAPKAGSRLVRYSVVGGLLLALLAGCGGITAGVLAGEGYLPGDSMRQVWSTPTDGGAPASGDAAWAAGDTLVHSNAAGVSGFDARTGERRWRYRPSRGAAICSAGRTAADGVALVAQGVPGSPVSDDASRGCTTVVALDLASGRELWRTTRTAAHGEIRAERDLVAAGGGLAVLRDEDADWSYESALGGPDRLDPDRALRAFDLRTGKPRWSARMPDGCVPYGVAAGARRVAALLVCDRRDVRLAVLDPADGRVRGVTPLDPRRVVDPLTHMPAFVSADPIVVSADSLDESGYATFLSFDDEGRAQGTIASGPVNGRITSPAQEPARTRVAYGRLYTVAMEADYDDVVTAFDLRSGQRLWRAEIGDLEDVMGLRVAGGRVTALVDLYGSADEDGLLVLDADDGDERDARTFPDSVGGSSGEIKDVLGHQDRLIAVRWSEGYLSPFTAYEER